MDASPINNACAVSGGSIAAIAGFAMSASSERGSDNAFISTAFTLSRSFPVTVVAGPSLKSSCEAFWSPPRPPPMQACKLRKRLCPHLPPCQPHPRGLCGVGQNFVQGGNQMEETQEQRIRQRRLLKASPSLKPYGVPRYRIALVCEEVGSSVSPPIQTSTAAAALLRPCFDSLDREQFLICGLDAKHRVIGINIVSLGSLTLSIVHPREVFKALILMNAAAFLCVHNHPSSDPTPSPEEIGRASCRE